MNLHNNYHLPQQQQSADPTGGLSNFSLLLISLNGLTIVVIALIFLCHRIPHDDDNNDQHNSLHAADNVAYEQALQDADVSLLNRAQRRARAKLLMKKSRRLDPSTENPAHDVAAFANHNNNNNHHDFNDDNIHHPRVQAGPDTVIRPRGTATLSRKERQKMAKEMERKERQANLEQIQLIQKQREIQEKATRQKVQLAKLQRIKQDKQMQLEKEYLHHNYMFPDTDLDTRVTVEEFLEDLNMNPVVSLEETAEEFHVSEEDLVYRLQELERDGRIPHGIWNRSMGEYIYISENVMKHVADYIMEKGAVSLADIKGELLRYIRAESGNEDVHDDGIKDDAPLPLEQKKVQ